MRTLKSKIGRWANGAKIREMGEWVPPKQGDVRMGSNNSGDGRMGSRIRKMGE